MGEKTCALHSTEPHPDMEKALRKHKLPLYSLETFSPLSEFDVLGFSLQYELTFTNVLTMLDLGGVPLHCSDRTMSDPLVIDLLRQTTTMGTSNIKRQNHGTDLR